MNTLAHNKVVLVPSSSYPHQISFLTTELGFELAKSEFINNDCHHEWLSCQIIAQFQIN